MLYFASVTFYEAALDEQFCSCIFDFLTRLISGKGQNFNGYRTKTYTAGIALLDEMKSAAIAVGRTFRDVFAIQVPVPAPEEMLNFQDSIPAGMQTSTDSGKTPKKAAQSNLRHLSPNPALLLVKASPKTFPSLCPPLLQKHFHPLAPSFWQRFSPSVHILSLPNCKPHRAGIQQPVRRDSRDQLDVHERVRR